MDTQSSHMRTLRLGILAIIFFSILGGFFVLKERILQPKAGGGPVTLSMQTDPATINPGDNFDLIVKTNPQGLSFYAFEIYIAYNPDQIEPQSGYPGNIKTSNTLIPNTSITMPSYTFPLVGIKPMTPFSGTADQEIARIPLRVKPTATGSVTFTIANTSKIGDGAFTINAIPGVFQLGSSGGGLPSTSQASFRLASSQSTYALGDNIDLQVFLNTAGNDVKSLDLAISYDDSKISFRDTSNLPGNISINTASGFNGSLSQKLVDPVARKVIVGLTTAGTATQAPVRGDSIPIATISFKARQDTISGTANFTLDISGSRIYDTLTRNILFATPITHMVTIGQGAPQPPQTPQQSSSGNVKLNLKVKFQGITKNPGDTPDKMVATVKLVKGTDIKTETGVFFRSDDSAVWSANTSFNAEPGGGYKILIKGPKHVQKRICDNNPQEGNLGIYSCTTGNITLTAGENNLDFSKIILLAGDTNKDGVINSVDLGIIRSSFDKTDESSRIFADLNFDGVVNANDFSLAIASLSFRLDEN